MRNLYFLGQNKSVAIYAYQNQIYRVTLDGGQMVRPVLLSGDYLSGLSDVYYRGTVYYSYITRNRELLLKNITERVSEYQMPMLPEVRYFFPQLAEWDGRLALFLVSLNREKGYQIRCELPFEEQTLILPDTYQTEPKYFFMVSGNSMICTVLAEGKNRVYLSEKMEEFHFLGDLGTAGGFEKTEEGKQVIGEEMMELTGKNKQLEEKIAEKEALIESVKVQYNDLMDTAIQYREEARKWREKYLTRK